MIFHVSCVLGCSAIRGNIEDAMMLVMDSSPLVYLNLSGMCAMLC
jgi:hypothetical protein